MKIQCSIGGIGSFKEGLTVAGNQISISAAQPSSSEMQRHYVYTTNLTDATCKVSLGEDESFYDLALQGAQHLNLSGASNNIITIPDG